MLNRLASLAASGGEEDLSDLHEPPGKEFLASLKYLDLDDKCYISGHSFGGATGNYLHVVFKYIYSNNKKNTYIFPGLKAMYTSK